MSGTMVRLVAGLSGLAVLLPAIIWGGVLAVQVIVAVSGVICMREYASMSRPDDADVATAWLLAGWVALFGIQVGAPGHFATVSTVVVVATFLFVTLRPGPSIERTADFTSRYVLGFAWVGLLLNLIHLRELENGLAWCFVVLAISWLGDTGAYFAGRSFGKHKLYERMSPKKTVEGAAGGVIAATIGVFGFSAGMMPGVVNPVHALVLGVVGCTMGILGDLGESMLKRSFGVKDAGNIMPGHGGLLDRIDSVLFVGTFVYAYATLVMGVA